jgi:hypothetical protein
MRFILVSPFGELPGEWFPGYASTQVVRPPECTAVQRRGSLWKDFTHFLISRFGSKRAKAIRLRKLEKNPMFLRHSARGRRNDQGSN